MICLYIFMIEIQTMTTIYFGPILLEINETTTFQVVETILL